MKLTKAQRGFAAVALYAPKSDGNVGGAIRAAGVFGAQLVVIGTKRLPVKGRVERTDPRSTHRHLPVQWIPDILEALPHECSAIAVEMGDGATELPAFQHPERAYYIFGAEDTGLPADIVALCDAHVSIPAGSLNLAAAVNVVLYDRASKLAGRTALKDSPNA